MLLIRKMDAWDFLNELSDSIEDSNVIDLCNDISDQGKEDSLDDVISHEFPDGVEEDELKEFFRTECSFIREQLGLKVEGDDNDDDSDEDYGD